MRRLNVPCGCAVKYLDDIDPARLEFSLCARHHATHLGGEGREREGGSYPAVPGCACVICEADNDTLDEDWAALEALREEWA